MRHARLLLLVTALVCAISCASGIGVKPVGKQEAYQQATANVLLTGTPSTYSQQYLQRFGLTESYEKQPQQALAELHARLGGLDETDLLFALAELSLHQAERFDDPRYHRAAAIYAYAFLFSGDEDTAPAAYDPRVPLAMDLYNRAIAEGLSNPQTGEIDLSPRRLALPFGSLVLSGRPGDFQYGARRLTRFAALSDYRIKGLRNQYRTSGIGAPLSAQTAPRISNPSAADRLGPQAKIPVTAVVRVNHPRLSLKSGHLSGTIELYDPQQIRMLTIDNRSVPLESDPSLALAYALEDSPLKDFAIAGFRRGDLRLFDRTGDSGDSDSNLYFISPYYPGRIPVVFVHGTTSTPLAWAQMLNDLLGDPRLSSRYQFWFFLYNSGNPVALSSLRLREDLQRAIQAIDPRGEDAALREMVVIGHSQGGLLTKMTVVSSGDRFWRNISQSKFEMATLSTETKDLLRRGLFVEPLPFVKRVIFISTPHHGSFLAEDWLGKIWRKFVRLPSTLTHAGAELVRLNPSRAKERALRIPTAIDNMNWSNPFLRTLAGLRVSPRVQAHSIIPVKGFGPLTNKSNDGVVRYASAHIQPVQSEFIVRGCGHSAQKNPKAIEEVRRILFEHAGIK